MFKVFIDDSGSKEYKTPYSRDFTVNAPPYAEYEQFWRDNYFVLCGVRVSDKSIGELNCSINRIKKKTFGTSKVEIKSDWLRNPHQRKKHYFDPYGVTNESLNAFGQEIIDFIALEKDRLKLIGVVFDKRFYSDKKRNLPEGNPLAKTSQVLFERIHYLNKPHTLIFDQMESSLKVEDGNNRLIVKVLRKNDGMTNVYVQEYKNISGIEFAHSHSENFLQMADICAYNIYRQFMEHGNEWDGHNSTLQTYDYFNRIRQNFISGRDKQVRGIGLTCIPDVNKTNWKICD